MKRTPQLALALLVSCLLTSTGLADPTAGMTTGKPDLKSVGPLAFGPNGILFVADARSAAVVAIDTQDTKPGASDKLLKIEGINTKLAALLGTAADQILVNDMAINPISRNAGLNVRNYILSQVEERRSSPRDDLFTVLAEADFPRR